MSFTDEKWLVIGINDASGTGVPSDSFVTKTPEAFANTMRNNSSIPPNCGGRYLGGSSAEPLRPDHRNRYSRPKHSHGGHQIPSGASPMDNFAYFFTKSACGGIPL